MTKGALRWLSVFVFALCALAVPAASVTVQESQAIRGGPAKYWHEVSGYGSDGKMVWTYPNGNVRLNWIEWRSGLPAGRYAVQVFIPRNHATTRHAVYHIKSGGAEIAAKVVDQNAYYDAWVDLGTYSFGGEPSVLLGDDTGESWRTGRKIGFDAVSFIPVSPPAPQMPGPGRMASGWYWPTGSSNFGGLAGWLTYVKGWGYHLGQDMRNGAGQPVFSIGDGYVISAGEHSGYGNNGRGYGGCVLVRYQAKDGTWFTAMYGHLDNYVRTGQQVYAGQIIGYTAPDWSPPHLHFSVHPGYNPEPTNPWRGYTGSKNKVYGFVDPISFLNAHPRL